MIFFSYCHFFVTSFCLNKSMKPKDWMKHKNKHMDAHHMNQLLRQSQQEEKKMLKTLSKSETFDYLVSKMNFCQRKELNSCSELGIHLHIGDICYIDYGLAYLYEIGYLHFGLVISIVNQKALVIPVSGNIKAYRQAYSKDHKYGKKHLMRLGCIEGMNKLSVLYMNDAKWINTARIIDVKAHINVDEPLFQDIKERMISLIADKGDKWFKGT